MPPIALCSEYDLSYGRAQHRLEQQLADSVPPLGALFIPSSWAGVSRRAKATERRRADAPDTQVVTCAGTPAGDASASSSTPTPPPRAAGK